MTVNKVLKTAIQKIKNDSGLKQAAVADKLGIKSTYLSDMIGGRVPFTQPVSNKLLEVFQINIGTDKNEPVIDDSMKKVEQIAKPAKKTKLQPMKKPKKPVTQERLIELKASSARMQEIKNDFQTNNVSKLERHLGVTHGIISNVIDMRNVMSDIIAEALKKYEYNYEWVMYGTLPKKKQLEEIPIKIKLDEKIESPQSEIIELLKDKVRLLEKINTLEEKLEREKRFGGSGTIPKTTTKIVKGKTAG